MISLNNKLLLKPYTGARKVKANISGGFASVSQKSTLVGLEAVADYVETQHILVKNPSIKKGQIVYFSEEILYANDWARKTYDCEAIKEKFIIADIGSVICVE